MTLKKTIDPIRDKKIIVDSNQQIITDVNMSNIDLNVSKEMWSNLNEPVFWVNTQLKDANDDQVRKTLKSSGAGNQIKFQDFKREGNLYVLDSGSKKSDEKKHSESGEERKIILTDI